MDTATHTVTLTLPSMAIRAVLEVLERELDHEEYNDFYENLDLRDFEAAKNAYGLAVAYDSFRKANDKLIKLIVAEKATEERTDNGT